MDLRRATTKVLVVDDQDAFRIGLAAILTEEGFAVETAASGMAALERAAAFEPDVILMDVGMPEISGIEATRRVLQVVVSARDVMMVYYEEGLVEAIAAGAGG